MKAKDLEHAIEGFLDKLEKHKEFWGSSLGDTCPDYPVRNHDEIKIQSRELCRALGQLRPYLDLYRTWVMQHSGHTWDALDAAVGLDHIAIVKGDSIESVVPLLDQIIGKLQAMPPDEDIQPKGKVSTIVPKPHMYVHAEVISMLKRAAKSTFDLGKLIKLCEEINIAHSNACYFATAMLLRSILNHIPPILGFTTFKEVASNYKCGRSLKDVLDRLENSSRKVADEFLHTVIREKEVLPSELSVKHVQELDMLLREICRVI